MKKVEAWNSFKEYYGGGLVNDLNRDPIKVQYLWTIYIDGLCKDKQITSKQYANWGNPDPISKAFSRKEKRFLRY